MDHLETHQQIMCSEKYNRQDLLQDYLLSSGKTTNIKLEVHLYMFWKKSERLPKEDSRGVLWTVARVVLYGC